MHNITVKKVEFFLRAVVCFIDEIVNILSLILKAW